MPEIVDEPIDGNEDAVRSHEQAEHSSLSRSAEISNRPVDLRRKRTQNPDRRRTAVHEQSL